MTRNPTTTATIITFAKLLEVRAMAGGIYHAGSTPDASADSPSQGVASFERGAEASADSANALSSSSLKAPSLNSLVFGGRFMVCAYNCPAAWEFWDMLNAPTQHRRPGP